jgi:hypothetical protein
MMNNLEGGHYQRLRARIQAILLGWSIPAWSELTTTNAPVADEPVEAVFRMNENPILPARIYIFFSPLFYPKIFPPTYDIPPPSYLPSTFPLMPITYLPLPSIARASETLSGSELGAGELRAGAWSLE